MRQPRDFRDYIRSNAGVTTTLYWYAPTRGKFRVKSVKGAIGTGAGVGNRICALAEFQNRYVASSDVLFIVQSASTIPANGGLEFNAMPGGSSNAQTYAAGFYIETQSIPDILLGGGDGFRWDIYAGAQGDESMQLTVCYEEVFE